MIRLVTARFTQHLVLDTFLAIPDWYTVPCSCVGKMSYLAVALIVSRMDIHSMQALRMLRAFVPQSTQDKMFVGRSYSGDVTRQYVNDFIAQVRDVFSTERQA